MNKNIYPVNNYVTGRGEAVDGVEGWGLMVGVHCWRLVVV